MQITYYFRTSILVLACILPAFTPALASGASTVPDSLLTEKYIRSIYISAPDSALHLLDEAEKHRLPSMPAFHIDILRSMKVSASPPAPPAPTSPSAAPATAATPCFSRKP